MSLNTKVLEVFLSEKSASSYKPQSSPLTIFQRAFDQRFQFVCWLGVHRGKNMGEKPFYTISCGVRLNDVENILDNYAVDVLKMSKSSSDLLMITFLKQFFEKKIIDESEVIEWVNSLVDPIVASPEEMFNYYWGCLRACEMPINFDVNEGYYLILRSLVVNLIEGTYDDDLTLRLLSKYSMEKAINSPEFANRLKWLKKKFYIA
jgi:hypothetical protein